MTRIAVNGVALNVVESGVGIPILLLHGFTGSQDTWAPFQTAWSGYRVIAADLLGHGDSDCPADPDRYRMASAVGDLLALLDALSVDRSVLLGYSLGGRIALRLALAAPERVRALILESTSPGIADPTDRAARRERDATLADTIERDGLPAFVAQWESLPLFAGQSRLPAATRARLRAQRLRHTAAGLANSLRGIGAGMDDPLFDRLPALTMPTLLIAGELDLTYVAHVQRMTTMIPRAEAALVPDAGHTVHLEQPDRFSRIVEDFLRRIR